MRGSSRHDCAHLPGANVTLAADLDTFLIACRDIFEVLSQDAHWVTESGELVPVESMTPTYRRNLLRFLSANAAWLARRYAFGAAQWLGEQRPVGEAAFAALERHIDRDTNLASTDPAQWLERTALGSRLSQSPF